MEDRKKTIRLVLVLAAVALVGAAGVALTVAERPISYTGSPPNPSESPPGPGSGEVAATPAAAREEAEEFPFFDEGGKPLRLADFRGRTVLVNLWATWCPPCVAEMPALDALQGRLGGESFQVVAVSLDRGGAAAARRWLDRAELTNLAVYNTSSVNFQGALLPTSILIDARGRVAWQGTGAKEWDAPALTAVVEGVIQGG